MHQSPWQTRRTIELLNRYGHELDNYFERFGISPDYSSEFFTQALNVSRSKRLRRFIELHGLSINLSYRYPPATDRRWYRFYSNIAWVNKAFVDAWTAAVTNNSLYIEITSQHDVASRRLIRWYDIANYKALCSAFRKLQPLTTVQMEEKELFRRYNLLD